jgi:hypothetical protein
MDQRERVEDLNTALLMALSGWQNEIWTAMPGIIESYDATTQTCKVNVPVQIMFKLGNSAPQAFTIPPLLDVPVIFPSGGGYTLTFPVAQNDECLVVFASRCIDAWWQNGTTGTPPYHRMHNLSDGFAILGARNQKRMLSPAPSGNSLQLRSDDGAAIIEIASGHTININATNVNVTASGTATIASSSIILKNAGSALKKLVNDTFITLFNTHIHTGGTISGNTGVPSVPATPTNATTVVQAE